MSTSVCALPDVGAELFVHIYMEAVAKISLFLRLFWLQQPQAMLQAEWMESSSVEKDLGMMVDGS